MALDLSIIIVTWNSRRDIENCLRALERYCTGVAVEIIVFDNASTDGTAAWVTANSPKTWLICSEVNLGFARANNRAAEKAQGRHLLFLNPDTWVDGDLATELVRFLDSNPRAGGCAPRVLNPDGSVQRGSMRTLPTLETLFYDQTGLSRLFPRSRRFGRYWMTWWDHNDMREVEQAAGACLAIRRGVFEQIGGFEESYFMFYEDVELCHAVLAAGWKIYFIPQARVYHIGGQSTIQAVSSNFPELYRSMYRYFRRHHGRGAAWLAKSIVGMGELGKLIVIASLLLIERFQHHPKYWRSRRQQFLGHGRLFLRHWFF
jgi:GT2 family glycosyltransferase